MIDKNKPAIGVLFTSTAKTNRSVPFKSKSHSRVHSIFSKRAERYGLNVFYAHHKEYKNGLLKRCWYNYNGRWRLAENQMIDVVYSRFAATMYKGNKKDRAAERFKYRMAKQVSMINHPIIDDFCWDKRIVADMFPKHSPRTFVVNTERGLETVLPEIKSEKVVIKPRYGTLGKNVKIVDKKKIPKNIEKNTIVQEFIDTSEGVKGVTDGMHDMRLFMINGQLDHAHIRIPKKGSLTANVALGGKKVFINNEHIPKRAAEIAKKVDKIFCNFHPRIFSVDFLFDSNGKPYIVECNSQPMIDKYAFGKYANISFYDRVIEALKSGIRVKISNKY
ncbi:ATP-grasp domain-containing protein [Candidatus Woesearchaeota archaeon]|nr:ATP-grasp domain-containing protein [Candidatus Woesearchaeota archaeon]